MFKKMIRASKAARLLGIAQRLARAEQWERAWPVFEQAIDADPAEGRVYAQYGLALCRVGRIDDAVDKLNDAIEAAPTSPAHRFGLAIVLCSVGRWDEADAAAAEGLELNARNPLGHSLRLLAGIGRGDTAEGCRKALDISLTDNLTVQGMFLGQAEKYLAEHDPVKVSLIFSEPTADDTPASPDTKQPAGVLIAAAEELMEEGRYASARAFLERARELDPGRTDATVELAATFIPLGDPDEALKRLLEIPLDDPLGHSQSITRRALGKMLDKLAASIGLVCGKAAAPLHRMSEALNPKGARDRYAGFALVNIGIASLCVGDLEAADAALKGALEEDDAADMRPMLAYLRGLVALEKGEHGRAAELFVPLIDYDWDTFTARLQKVIDIDAKRRNKEQ